MASILIVEDSDTQLMVIQRSLESAGFEVDTACDGESALTAIAKCEPEVVLTDLVMPGMNGIELVKAIRIQYSHIPVVLMTAFGNEEIAIEALQAGASNYIPKRNLDDELVGKLLEVLSVSVEKRQDKELLNAIDEVEIKYLLRNEVNLIGPLVKRLQDQMASMKLCDETGLMRAGTALCEALSNAIIHGNLEVSSDLREEENDVYSKLIESRSRENGYKDRRVCLEAKFCPTEFVFVVRDEGAGFDWSDLPDPTDPENLEKPSGRGLLLIQTFMDELQFNQNGNEITMTLRRAARD